MLKRLALLLLLSPPLFAADATRFEDQVEAYEALSEPRGAMVVAGSSTIKLWRTIEADLDPLEVIPRGLVGSQIPDWSYYLSRLVLAEAPSSVVFYLGDNDLNAGKTPQFIADGLRDLALRVNVKYPKARIYFIAIKPSPARWDQWPLAKKTNSLIKTMATSDGRYQYIDTAPALLGTDGKPKSWLYASDGLHFNVSGYKAWTSIVRPALQKVQVTLAPMPPTGVHVE